MLRSIFSVMLLVSFSAFSQQAGKPQAKPLNQDPAKDTVTVVPVKADRYGLRVGIDAYRLARSFFDDGYRGIELVGDYRLTKKIYAAAELGNLKYTVDDTQLNFTTTGNYIKIGFDYNAYTNWLDMENMIYIGGRYGFSNFSQKLNSYKVYQNSTLDDTSVTVTPTNYLEEVTVQANRDYSGLSAHWLELVGGAKAELFDNLFLGVSVRLNILITQKKPADFDNLYIPGFNRTYDGNFGVGLNYTLSYFIPLYKKQAAKADGKKQAKK
ncbi:hypothetical protein Q765_04465 [Flavobacterium rivuli WB 3.3-2 = DSM 21788]|uniref:Outer membrane protein beta-barrel domain-containing protein n=1 Tax=Flavobacterium rivuli WB 3.3-2 = DSM 21788 TaxID=1121895 RepID=A0A0A2M816_9FLAO|nr:DUF6048 family protein [Flavobacterium rivuli]KGO87751.1 hypothetical protein Q765_04465 [Flavobacterium rivuli WB 3.3-2 = DSM 21788]